MTKIMTVLGPIAPDELGFTSMHEHIFLDVTFSRERFESLLEGSPIAANDPVSLDNIGYLKHNPLLTLDNLKLDDEDVMAAEVADFKASGGDAILEASAPGIRANTAGLRNISEKTGVHVIASTGLYAQDTWPERFGKLSKQEYIDYVKREIEHGIEDTGIKPGNIKAAVELDPDSQLEEYLRAAVCVSNDTGLMVSVHNGWTLDSAGVRRVAEILLDEGVNPERVLMCHMCHTFGSMDLKELALNPEGWTPTIELHKELLDYGFNISIDTFGQYFDGEIIGFVHQTDWQRMAGLVAMVKAGYSKQLVMGTDVAFKILTRRFGGEGYCRLTNNIVPALRDILEVSEADIHRMTVENPARLLAH